ncbi:penicillin-binding protein 2 [Neptunicoccus sediminis]|uniref:penicillin-binding protein 2 n=1 Tax=Neptunicoccus sediminis TaxID=1892596 RepID=UPI0008460225|nr:penicillin-binding protein 2 [Neptunicoccus sediminis]
MRRPVKPGRLRQMLTRRTILLAGLQAGIIGTLGVQMRRIAVEQNQSFRLLAEENRVNIRLIPPVRGLIFDRLGKPLAYNEPNYKIDMVREQSGDPETVLRRLATIIPISESDITSALEEMSKRRGFVPVTVAEDLDWEHIAAVSANAPALPGITPELGHYRIYPQADDFAHILGFVGPVSDYDLSQTDDDDPLLLIPRFQIGKNGIERRIEKPLRGKSGVKRIEVNSIGRVMRVLGREESQPGANVQLTIDNRLQRYAMERLGKESAAAVVMDVRNGDIVTLASAPSFDPNKFVRGISTTDWNALNTDIYKPMLNKTVTGTYPPGSTFKMVTALAALKGGFVKPDDKVYCGGYLELHNRRFHCWRRGGHGKVNMHDSLKKSCDVYYYEISQEVGIENISAMAKELGIGVEHELELPAVREGLAPTKDWKKRRRDADWVIGDTLNASIGQGFVLASPMQLAVMTARIASGTKISPRLVNAIDNRPQPVKGREPLDIDPEHLNAVRKGMYGVVNERGGTAGRSRIRKEGWDMAGKTGTSQVRFITKEERARGVIRNRDLPWERRDHALFVAYAPADNPRFSISVVVEHGGGGSTVAAPIARDIMLEALELSEDMDYRSLPTDVRAGRERPDDKA